MFCTITQRNPYYFLIPQHVFQVNIKEVIVLLDVHLYQCFIEHLLERDENKTDHFPVLMEPLSYSKDRQKSHQVNESIVSCENATEKTK